MKMLTLILTALAAFVIEIGVSFVSTYAYSTGIIPQNYTVCVLLALLTLVLFIIALVVGIILLNKPKFGFVPQQIAVAYFCVFAVFAVITLFMSATSMEPYLSYLFLGYKVFAFGILPRILSAIIINATVFAICIITPILCDKQYEADRIRSYLHNGEGSNS